MQVRSGVTRTVFIGKRWAVKVPRAQLFGRDAGAWSVHLPLAWFVRGWLGNRSEWKQRYRRGVNPPLFTLGYLVQLYRAADELIAVEDDPPAADLEFAGRHALGGLNADETKGSSWGRFGDFWLLIDFDRACEHPRGIVGGLYYGRQERLARKWANLPCSCPDVDCEGKVGA